MARYSKGTQPGGDDVDRHEHLLLRRVDEDIARGVVVEAGLETEVQVGTITADIKPTFGQKVEIGFVRAAMTRLGQWTGDQRWH